MPGRRVSRHSKAKTLPSTVALPIFRFKSFMGPGRLLMAFPMRILPLFFSAGAPGAETEEAWASSFTVSTSSTDRKPYTAARVCFKDACSSSVRGLRTVRWAVMESFSRSMTAPVSTAPARRSRSSPESWSSVNISKNGISLDMVSSLCFLSQKALTAPQSLSSMRLPAAPGAPCKGFPLCGTAAPRPCRQRCRYPPRRPRRGR